MERSVLPLCPARCSSGRSAAPHGLRQHVGQRQRHFAFRDGEVSIHAAKGFEDPEGLIDQNRSGREVIDEDLPQGAAYGRFGHGGRGGRRGCSTPVAGDRQAPL